MKIEFAITDEYIELIKLLKAIGLCSMGSEAKQAVEEQLVKLNGKTELRKRAKIRKGDVVEFQKNTIVII